MARTEDIELKLTMDVVSGVWKKLEDILGPVHADTDTFMKCVHTGSVENKQLNFTFMERLEQAKEEAVAVQDFEAAVDIRDLMDNFKKAGK